MHSILQRTGPDTPGRMPNPMDREDFGDVIKMVLGGGF